MIGVGRMSDWKFLFGGSFALNVLGLLVLVGAWFWRAQLYRQWIHPTVTARQVSFFKQFPVGTGDVVFLGDSLTSQGRWGELFPGVPVRNRGISGDVTADVLARLEEITTASPSQIFLMIGTNDLGLGLSEEVLLGNVSAILEEIRRASPETELYLQTLLPRSEAYVEQIRSVNTSLAEMAARAGVTLVDVGGAMRSPTGTLRPELTDDELHLSGPGYAIWGETLADWVRTPARDKDGEAVMEEYR